MKSGNKMKLLEFVILKGDVNTTLEYLGKSGNFQMYKNEKESVPPSNEYKEIFDHLRIAATYLNILPDSPALHDASFPTDEDKQKARAIINDVEDMEKSIASLQSLLENAEAAYNESQAFSKLNLPYNELDSLTFLTIRIGRIADESFESLKFSMQGRALIIPINEERSKIVVAASKKARFALDSELKKADFVQMEIPKNFKGMPEDVLQALTDDIKAKRASLQELKKSVGTYAATKRDEIITLLKQLSIAYQVLYARCSLDEAQEVYRLRGWVAERNVKPIADDLQKLTSGRVALQVYDVQEIPDVMDGAIKVPVHYKHNKFVQSFERMVFSYGIPQYGTVDPTPIVAALFTLLFGIMFGDVGQGAVIFLVGLILKMGKISALKDWKKFSYVFIAMGSSSMVMGLLTGEVFTNSTVLIPFSRAVTSLFGTPHDHILHLMPEAGAISKLMYFFAFTLLIGFIINSLGILINIINNIRLKRFEHAVLGKFGLVGLLFFWYVVFMVCRMVFVNTSTSTIDAIFVSATIILVFFEHPLIRLIKKQKPILENGAFAGIINGLVEVLELLSTFISNSVSFLRVGAFALSHAVLSFIVFKLTDLVGGYFSLGLLVTIFGNFIIILLESLIVTIQVVRLQYYEFFSKFFTETGVEFKPFKFEYQE